MALRHLDSRLAPLEARYGLSDADNGGSDIDARLAEAEQKRVAMAKEARINKIEKMIEQHEESKQPNENLEPAKPEDQPEAEDRDDRYKRSRFDPSCGNQAQKTPQHPVSDELNWHQIEAARERAVMRGWISAITEYNTRRWA